jgi:MFS family permease
MLLLTQKRDPELYPCRNGLYFAFFNALNWQVATGAPTVLFMEYLGANSFQTGLVFAWTLLLTPVQVFATLLLPRLGFKRLTLAGWGARSWFLLVPLVLALISSATPTPWMIYSMVAAMFFYSLSRSMGAAAITTWLQALVPTTVRGRYWASDQIMGGIAAVGTLVVCAGMFAVFPARWAFFGQYVISISGAYLALRCLRALPDIDRPVVMGWKKISTDTPRHLFARSSFRPYLWLAVLFYVVTTPIAPFGAYYLKATAGFSVVNIMLYTMLQYGGVIGGNWFMRSRLDQTGAKPFFRLAFALFALIALGWLACLHWSSTTFWLMPVLFALLGAGTGIFTAANVSYLTSILPENDRALPVSLHGALTWFLGGLSPVAWGLFLKGTEPTPALDLHAFKLFFVVILCGALALIALVNLLEEKEGQVEPILFGSWLLGPFRGMGSLINLTEAPRKIVPPPEKGDQQR